MEMGEQADKTVEMGEEGDKAVEIGEEGNEATPAPKVIPKKIKSAFEKLMIKEKLA